MPAINLMTLANNASASITQLNKLVSLSSGPLRIEHRNGQVHLGVRSWSTYFFEKIVASDKELELAKLKTQIAIETHVRAFLNSPDGAMNAAKEELVMNLLHTRTTEKFVTRPVLLKSKKGPDTKPESRTKNKICVDKVFDKPSNGAILVQRGVSVAQPSALEQAGPELKVKAEWVKGIVSALFNPLSDKNLNFWISKVVDSAIKPAITNSTLHVIADVRLVRKETNRSATKDLLKLGETVELQYTDDFKNFRSKAEFTEYYGKQLKNAAWSVKSTLLLELPYDSEPVCTNANIYGATDAAHLFIEEQKSLGKTVSVMIVVPSLPAFKPKSDTGDSIDGASNNGRQSKNRTSAHKEQPSDQKNMLEADA